MRPSRRPRLRPSARALSALAPLVCVLAALLVPTWAARLVRAADEADVRGAVAALGSTTAPEREEAAAALRALLEKDPDRVVPAILEALLVVERPHTWAARRLIVDAGERAIEPLLRCAGDARPGVGRTASTALGEIGAPVVPRALELIRRGGREASALGARGLMAVGKAALPATLAEIEVRSERRSRQMLAMALGDIGRGAPEAVPPLVRILESEDDGEGAASMRTQAARSLGLVGAAATETAVPALERVAISGRSGTTLQVRSAWALGEIGGPRALDALVHIVTATAQERGEWSRVDPEVSEMVAHALAGLGRAAHARLVALSRSSDPEEHVVALRALAHVGPLERTAAIDEALRDGLGSDFSPARDAAEHGLTGGDRGARLALALLRDPSVVLRRRAAALFARWKGIAHAASAPPNAAHLERWGGFAAAARPALSTALDDDDALVRLDAARALAAIGPEALPALAARLGDPWASPRARAGAARAISGRRYTPVPHRTSRALIDACAPSEPAEVREAAAAALRAWDLDPPPGAPPPPALGVEERALLSWFDGLGYPSLAGRGLVEVRNGGWSRSGGAAPEAAKEVAILLEDAGASFRVLGLDLEERSHARNEDAEWPVTFAPLDLERTATEVVEARRAAREARLQAERDLEAGKADPSRLSALSEGRFGERISQRAELFVLARLCEANGVTGAARSLLEEVRSLSAPPPAPPQPRPARGTPVRPPPRAPTVHELLEADMGHAEMWRAVLAFGDPDVPRRVLLGRFRAFPGRFAASDHVRRARETATLLGPMVEEDEARARRGPLPPDAPLDARIALLIVELRDQNGHQWSQPGACDIFNDPRGEASPAHRLVAIGMPAVPRLIEAANDPRPTRSVGYHRDFYFSHYVLTVGDCAIAIVQAIAKRPFYRRASTSGAAVKDGQAPSVQAEMRAWWAALQEKGEEGFLRDAVARGDGSSPYEAQKLAERYPASALGPIAEGARRAERGVRASLVGIAGGLEGASATAFLAEEMQAAPDLAVRVAAAQGLHARGDTRAVPAMIAAWREASAPRPASPETRRGPRAGIDEWEQDLEDRDLRSGILGFLAASGDAEAIRALGDDLGARSLDVRVSVVEAFDPGASFGSRFTIGGGGVGTGGGDAPRASTGAAEQAIEALLVASLDDAAVRTGMGGTRDGESYRDPRVSDLAASALAARYPERYGFHIGGTTARKDREIAVARNTWRRARGLPTTPLPDVPVAPEVDAKDVADAARAIREADGPAAIAAAIARMERLGPGAIRVVDEQERRLFPDGKLRPDDHGPDLSALRRRLALQVREVRIATASAGIVPTPAVVDALASLEGRPLPAGALADALVAFARAGEPEGRTLAITIERPGDRTGVVIRAVFSHDRARRAGGMASWGSSHAVEIGGESLGSSGGSMSPEYARERKAYASLEEALGKAVEAAPDVGWSARASVTSGGR